MRAWEEYVFCCCWMKYSTNVNSWLMMLFSSMIFLLTFCLPVLMQLRYVDLNSNSGPYSFCFVLYDFVSHILCSVEYMHIKDDCLLVELTSLWLCNILFIAYNFSLFWNYDFLWNNIFSGVLLISIIPAPFPFLLVYLAWYLKWIL